MALLDVSFLLTDPDFADQVAVWRPTQTVDAHGVALVSYEVFVITACIAPASGAVLELIPEAERALESISVSSITPLRVANGSDQADEVDWNDKRYRVSIVQDYSNFGAGFTVATCLLKSPT